MVPLSKAEPDFQWPMVGVIGIIFIFHPETPWWLASKGKLDKSRKVLQLCNGGVEGYDIEEQIVSVPLNCCFGKCSLVQGAYSVIYRRL